MRGSETRDLASMGLSEVKKTIATGKLAVTVIGIGRIGLPTAVSFANAGLPTLGVDINTKLVETVNSGKWPLNDEPGFEAIFGRVFKKKLFWATTDISGAVPKSNIVVLSLPTPMNKNGIPDYSALRTVGKSLSGLLEPHSLVIVESTVEPGFIENELTRIIEGDGRRIKFGKNAGMAACPETANPGAILHDFKKVPRLVGALDSKTAQIVGELYRHVFGAEIIQMSDCKAANAAKLAANVFRDINIAFVNELAILFEKLDIDVLEVLKACDKKYNFETHYPGAGVGGPCLPVNSYQILHSLSGANGSLRIVKAAREINEGMPYHVVDLLVSALDEAKKPVKDSTVTILGISYKPEVKDAQLSPAEHIIQRVQELGAKVRIYDPYFKSTAMFSRKTEESLPDAVKGSDAVVIVTAHKEFYDLEPEWLLARMNTRPVIVDGRGIFDKATAKKAGLIFRGIGRGAG
jgi:nucleotide sugar dehydrogenase